MKRVTSLECMGAMGGGGGGLRGNPKKTAYNERFSSFPEF